MTTDHPGQMPPHQVVDLMRAHERTQMPYLNDPTPQPDPAVVLTDVDAKTIDSAVHWWEEFGGPLHDVIAGAAQRIVAARTADAAARLAAVEALLAKADRTDTACVPASRLRAALSAPAPDAGCTCIPGICSEDGECCESHDYPDPDAGQSGGDRR